jgi:hypothetical protein
MWKSAICRRGVRKERAEVFERRRRSSDSDDGGESNDGMAGGWAGIAWWPRGRGMRDAALD